MERLIHHAYRESKLLKLLTEFNTTESVQHHSTAKVPQSTLISHTEHQPSVYIVILPHQKRISSSRLSSTLMGTVNQTHIPLKYM